MQGGSLQEQGGLSWPLEAGDGEFGGWGCIPASRSLGGMKQRSITANEGPARMAGSRRTQDNPSPRYGRPVQMHGDGA